MNFKYAVTLVSLFVSINSFAVVGKEGGGGTAIAAEFAYVGKVALSILVERGSLSAKAAEEALQKTSVFDVGSLCKLDPNTGGVIDCSLDARYNAVLQKIEFNRNQWVEKSCAAKFTLAAHEYLRAAGIENSNYSLSNIFLGGLENEYVVLMNNSCRELPSNSNKNKKSVSNEAPIVTVPRHAKIYATTKNCGTIKATGQAFDLEVSGEIVSEFKCNGESFSMVKIFPIDGRLGGSVFTYKTSVLIK